MKVFIISDWIFSSQICQRWKEQTTTKVNFFLFFEKTYTLVFGLFYWCCYNATTPVISSRWIRLKLFSPLARGRRWTWGWWWSWFGVFVVSDFPPEWLCASRRRPWSGWRLEPGPWPLWSPWGCSTWCRQGCVLGRCSLEWPAKERHLISCLLPQNETFSPRRKERMVNRKSIWIFRIDRCQKVGHKFFNWV